MKSGCGGILTLAIAQCRYGLMEWSIGVLLVYAMNSWSNIVLGSCF